MNPAVPRYRTALNRTHLSRPLAQALGDGLVGPGSTVFDYGCGRGDDLLHLKSLGFEVNGWDPAHRPDAERKAADVVNLGYVVNVIEHQDERIGALRAAWALARRLLVVAARLSWDQKQLSGRPLADGLVTRTGSFQKFYEQAELAAWIEQVVGRTPIAAAPGIFYLFRSDVDAQQYLANRVSSYQPRVRIDPHELYEAHREVLTPLLDFLSDHARPPRPDELEPATLVAIQESLGGIARAHRLVRQVTDTEVWDRAAQTRQADLLVYIGLSRFERRPRLSQLPGTLARDIKVHFGSYQSACAKADRLLYAAGQTELLRAVARKSRVGKQTPEALYVHRSALSGLPPVLRIYEGCGQVLAGTVTAANVIKLSLSQPQVSYLTYPTFDRQAHPVLQEAVTVNLRQLIVDFRDYSQSANPPILHRKEEFVPEDYPRWQLWSALTRAEERAGLYDQPSLIGTRVGWDHALEKAGRRLRGHRLVQRGR